jgi:hypothetical protein
MNKLLLCVSIFSLMLTSCGGDSDSDSEAVVVNPTECSSVISNFSVAQNFEKLMFNITASPGALYYEASLSATNNNRGADEGIIMPLDVETNSISLYSYLNFGDNVVYVRSVCADGTKGAWNGPKIISISEFCGAPSELNVTPLGVSWNYNFVAEAANYQVQYGPAGFNLGSGTIVTVNNERFNDASLRAGQAYDFYVRAFCTNGLSYGNWTGPFTYFAEGNQNMCLAPANVAHSSEGNGYYAFTFDYNGEDQWEYTLVVRNQNVSEGTLHTLGLGGWPVMYLNSTIDYDFYIRAVCNDGSRTAWTKHQVNP